MLIEGRELLGYFVVASQPLILYWRCCPHSDYRINPTRRESAAVWMDVEREYCLSFLAIVVADWLW